VACPPGDFGKLAQAEIPTAVITSKQANAKPHARCDFSFFPAAPDAAKTSDRLASSTPNPLVKPVKSGPGSDGV
jgi:hypothetical protein